MVANNIYCVVSLETWEVALVKNKAEVSVLVEAEGSSVTETVVSIFINEVVSGVSDPVDVYFGEVKWDVVSVEDGAIIDVELLRSIVDVDSEDISKTKREMTLLSIFITVTVKLTLKKL